MGDVRQALKMQREAQRRRALAPEYDLVRRNFELDLADRMEEEAQALLTPPKPLKTGLGGEIVPQVEDGLPGLESVLQEPDLLSAEASKQRAHLLEQVGALELGVEAAEGVKAGNAIEKMLAHQMAALHRRALTLLAESEACKDADVAVKQARAAARMADAISRAAITLMRLQSGASQVVQIQHVQVVGQAVIGQVGGLGEKLQNQPDHAPATEPPKNRGGRPATNGYRTAAAIADRKADKQLIAALVEIKK